MRNRTIRSVLARRPMFANGGMLPPVTQNPMAAGILASSSPLVETVNNQQSPNQGVRVSMKDGGIAKFANGGTPPSNFSYFELLRTGKQPTSAPYITPTPLPKRTIREAFGLS